MIGAKSISKLAVKEFKNCGIPYVNSDYKFTEKTIEKGYQTVLEMDLEQLKKTKICLTRLKIIFDPSNLSNKEMLGWSFTALTGSFLATMLAVASMQEITLKHSVVIVVTAIIFFLMILTGYSQVSTSHRLKHYTKAFALYNFYEEIVIERIEELKGKQAALL